MQLSFKLVFAVFTICVVLFYLQAESNTHQLKKSIDKQEEVVTQSVLEDQSHQLATNENDTTYTYMEAEYAVPAISSTPNRIPPIPEPLLVRKREIVMETHNRSRLVEEERSSVIEEHRENLQEYEESYENFQQVQERRFSLEISAKKPVANLFDSAPIEHTQIELKGAMRLILGLNAFVSFEPLSRDTYLGLSYKIEF
jgi:type IV secretory pathway VirB10-like protein